MILSLRKLITFYLNVPKGNVMDFITEITKYISISTKLLRNVIITKFAENKADFKFNNKIIVHFSVRILKAVITLHLVLII